MDDAARTRQIYQEVDNCIFDAPLSTYKRKDDLVTLAGTPSLPMEGTVVELTKAINGHLVENSSCMNDLRFTALFSSSNKHSMAVPDQQQQVSLLILLHRHILPRPSEELPSSFPSFYWVRHSP